MSKRIVSSSSWILYFIFLVLNAFVRIHRRLLIFSGEFAAQSKAKSHRPVKDSLMQLPLAFLHLVITIVFLHSCVMAQDAERTARAPGTPAGSYSLGDNDAINLFTGDLNYYLPLYASGGRGNLQAKLGVVFEQQWDRKEIPAEGWPEGYLDHQYNSRYPEPLTFVGSMKFVVSNSGTDEPCNNQTDRYVVVGATMVYVEPNGTEHLLRDTRFHGLPHNECVVGENLGKLFESSAGEFVTFISDADMYTHCYPTSVCTNFNSVDGYLYFRDGTKSRVVAGNIIWMQDRNGNRIDYLYEANPYDPSLKRVIKITDSVGREINIVYYVSDPEPYGLCIRITFKGVRGEDKIIRISHDSNLSHLLRSTQPYDSTTPADIADIEHDDPNDSIILTGGSIGRPFYVKAIWLPNGRSYQFKYNVLGQLARVDFPTGGAIEYDFADIFQIPFPPIPDQLGPITNAVSEKRVYNTNNVLVGKTKFSKPTSYTEGVIPQTRGGTVRDVEVFDPAGNRLSKSRHYFYGRPDTQWPLVVPWWHGREFRTETFDLNGTSLLRVAEQDWRERTPSWCSTYEPCSYNPTEQAPTNNPFVVETKSTLVDGNLIGKTSSVTPGGSGPESWGFDDYNNQTDVWQYDYGVGQPGPLIRHVQRTYINNANALGGLYLLGLSATESVYAIDSSGQATLAASTQVLYDEYSQYSLLTYGSVLEWQDPGGVRGNPTSVKRWLNSTNTWIETHAQYDQCGNVRASWDANGKQSQIEYSSNSAYAYPTLTRTAVPDSSGAYGSTTAFVTTSVYDFSTGAVTSTTDANGQTTSFEYDDALNRLTKVNSPDGGRTTYTYVDAHQCGPYVETRTLLDSSGRETDTYQFFDGLGRRYLTESHENQDPNNPYLRVDTQYDAMGRAWRVSNPYRSTGCTAAINPSGRWTQSTFDPLSRPTQTKTTGDNAVVTTYYSGTTVTVTDQAGRKRRSLTDALGRLVRVDEPNKDTGNLDVGGASTSYAYDVLGNLRKVDQGTQQRYFMYDSLSRLIRAMNPEQAAGSVASNITDPITGRQQWSMAYGYDNNGNLTARVDARNTTTNYAYDALNRNVSVTYSDGTTPAVYRYYDSATNGKGRLYWDQAVGVSANVFDAYDAAGRPTQYHQRFWVNGGWGQYFNLNRTYDKVGQVLSQTNPSGHTVNYTYDIAGRFSSDTGNLGDGVPRSYATGMTYSELGGLQQEQFGTQTPLYHKLHYNVRGQLADNRLSTAPWQTDEWNWNRGAIENWYDSSSGFPHPSTNGTDNNGNLLRSEVYIPNDDQISSYSFIKQSYSYDWLNRLTALAEYQNGSTQTFEQSYDYDRWSNRTINPSSSISNTQFDKNDAATTNRLYAPGDTAIPTMSQRRIQYDPAGNQTFDSYTGQGTRTYDAENRMTQAWANNQWQTYTYDADGRRIKRNVNGVETWQVYGMDGELLAEYSSGAAPYLPATEYGYRAGELLVTITSGDTQRLSRFVTNLYYGALQRDPTSSELQDRVNQLAAAGVVSQAQLLNTASEIARSLFSSTGYESSPYRDDAQYVSDLYYAYLQRGPDDGGLNFWAGQAASNRVNVCNAFEASGEFQTLVATLYGTAASDSERTEHFVNNFYLGSYGRSAIPTELQQQRDALNTAAEQGQSAVQTQAETFGRSLFAAQVNDGSLSNTQYVTNLYEAFLQRGPDAGGLGWWAGQASVGQGRQNVLNAFATCGAFRGLAGTLYREANWLIADHLGTPRMIVTKSGALAGIKRHDYLPFGEELFAGTGGRTTGQGYTNADGARQKFTQKERDIETGLDYFLARYYSSTQGRFTNADDFLNDTRVADPASWNLYAYVRNNPLRYVDPLGQTIEETQDKKHKLTKDEKKAIEKDLRAKTGLSSIQFDKNGKLTYDKNEKAQGGSAQLRQGITGAIDDTKNVFQLGDYSGSENIQFALTDAGTVLSNTGVTTYQVEIDFADFRDAKNLSDSGALNAFSLGLTLDHEIDHKVSYDPSNPVPIGGRLDEGVGGVIADVNVAQSQLGLATRAPGSHTGQPYSGPDSRYKNTYQIQFNDASGKAKFVRWKLENQRQR